jgi:2-furoate---CoA ligase
VPAAFVPWRRQLSCLYLVPTLYHDLVRHERFALSDVRSVRKLGFAGAAMPEGSLKRVATAFKPELFVNHYGSSEICTFTIEPDAARKPGSAGKAACSTRATVRKSGRALRAEENRGFVP